MTREKHLVLFEMSQEQMARLRQLSGEREIVYCPEQSECTQQMVDEAAIIWGNVPKQFLHESPQLRWVQIKNAGYVDYIQPGLLHADTILTNGTGAYGLNISEHMIALTLMLMKHMHVHHARQMNNQWVDGWSERRPVYTIKGCSVLVVGFGDIGKQFALKMKALGARRVMGLRRTPRPVDGIETYGMDRLDELLPQADVVALCMPENPESIGLMDEKRLAKVKPGAFLINVGRGNAVDTPALVQAMQEGRLGGVGLDVTNPEPLPPEHPLWSMENCLITPHCSGDSYIKATLDGIIEIALNNLDCWNQGQPLKNVVAH